MKFVTLFLRTKNINLIKDIGMIPYLLKKEHNVTTELVTWDNGPYPFLEDKVDGLRLTFVKKGLFGRISDGMRYLKDEAPSIDVLNIYHLNPASYFYQKVYLKLNPMGKIYLKLDMNNKGFEDCLKFSPKGLIKRAIIKRADLVSVENKRMAEALAKKFKDKIIYLPNGCFCPEAMDAEDEDPTKQSGNSSPAEKAGNSGDNTSTPEKKAPAKEIFKKEDMILTVGNLGTYEKATEVLLNAFAKSSLDHSYSLCLAGPVDPAFEKTKDAFFEKYPELKSRVTFTGNIEDREELFSYYEKARYFILPSRSESFGFVLLEAGLKGCFLICSDGCSSALDITDNEKFGRIFKSDDEKALAELITELCTKKPDFDQELLIRHIRKNYNWRRIVDDLYTALKEKLTIEATQERLPSDSGL